MDLAQHWFNDNNSACFYTQKHPVPKIPTTSGEGVGEAYYGGQDLWD